MTCLMQVSEIHQYATIPSTILKHVGGPNPVVYAAVDGSGEIKGRRPRTDSVRQKDPKFPILQKMEIATEELQPNDYLIPPLLCQKDVQVTSRLPPFSESVVFATEKNC